MRSFHKHFLFPMVLSSSSDLQPLFWDDFNDSTGLSVQQDVSHTPLFQQISSSKEDKELKENVVQKGEEKKSKGHLRNKTVVQKNDTKKQKNESKKSEVIEKSHNNSSISNAQGQGKIEVNEKSLNDSSISNNKNKNAQGNKKDGKSSFENTSIQNQVGLLEQESKNKHKTHQKSKSEWHDFSDDYVDDDESEDHDDLKKFTYKSQPRYDYDREVDDDEPRYNYDQNYVVDESQPRYDYDQKDQDNVKNWNSRRFDNYKIGHEDYDVYGNSTKGYDRNSRGVNNGRIQNDHDDWMGDDTRNDRRGRYYGNYNQRKQIGEGCAVHQDCDENLICFDFLCSNKKQEGERCDVRGRFFENFCIDGLACTQDKKLSTQQSPYDYRRNDWNSRRSWDGNPQVRSVQYGFLQRFNPAARRDRFAYVCTRRKKVQTDWNCYSKVAWSADKKEYCCREKRIGCEQTDYNCYTRESWSADKKEYCCREKRIGCEQTDYNCYTRESWSADKKEYCCREKRIGCASEPDPYPQSQSKCSCPVSDYLVQAIDNARIHRFQRSRVAELIPNIDSRFVFEFMTVIPRDVSLSNYARSSIDQLGLFLSELNGMPGINSKPINGRYIEGAKDSNLMVPWDKFQSGSNFLRIFDFKLNNGNMMQIIAYFVKQYGNRGTLLRVNVWFSTISSNFCRDKSTCSLTSIVTEADNLINSRAGAYSDQLPRYVQTHSGFNSQFFNDRCQIAPQGFIVKSNNAEYVVQDTVTNSNGELQKWMTTYTITPECSEHDVTELRILTKQSCEAGTVGGGSCTDKDQNCDRYGQTACTHHQGYMMENCQKFCNQCPNTPQFVCTTREVWSAEKKDYCCQEKGIGCPTSECMDEESSCIEWAKNNFCTDRQYEPFMSRKCLKSCGLCPSTDYGTEPDISCVDKDQNCATWAKQNHCHGGAFTNFMKENCQKSCDFCTGGQGPYTTITATTTAGYACVDTDERCQRYEQFCKDPKFVTFMTTNCQKTCNTCTGQYGTGGTEIYGCSDPVSEPLADIIRKASNSPFDRNTITQVITNFWDQFTFEIITDIPVGISCSSQASGAIDHFGLFLSELRQIPGINNGHTDARYVEGTTNQNALSNFETFPNNAEFYRIFDFNLDNGNHMMIVAKFEKKYNIGHSGGIIKWVKVSFSSTGENFCTDASTCGLVTLSSQSKDHLNQDHNTDIQLIRENPGFSSQMFSSGTLISSQLFTRKKGVPQYLVQYCVQNNNDDIQKWLVTFTIANYMTIQHMTQILILTRQTCVTEEASCQDEDDVTQCQQWIEFCDDLKHKDYMQVHCAKTCNLCPTSYIATTTCEPDVVPPCEDKDGAQRCQQWMSFCNDSKYGSYMIENCAKTCNLCPTSNTTTTTCETDVVTPTVPCFDEDQQCSSYGNAACTNAEHQDYMKEKCKKFCNFCSYTGAQTTSICNSNFIDREGDDCNAYVQHSACINNVINTDPTLQWLQKIRASASEASGLVCNACGCGKNYNTQTSCNDIDPKCSQYGLANCTNPQYQAYMAIQCRNFCQLCDNWIHRSVCADAYDVQNDGTTYHNQQNNDVHNDKTQQECLDICNSKRKAHGCCEWRSATTLPAGSSYNSPNVKGTCYYKTAQHLRPDPTNQVCETIFATLVYVNRCDNNFTDKDGHGCAKYESMGACFYNLGVGEYQQSWYDQIVAAAKSQTGEVCPQCGCTEQNEFYTGPSAPQTQQTGPQTPYTQQTQQTQQTGPQTPQAQQTPQAPHTQQTGPQAPHTQQTQQIQQTGPQAQQIQQTGPQTPQAQQTAPQAPHTQTQQTAHTQTQQTAPQAPHTQTQQTAPQAPQAQGPGAPTPAAQSVASGPGVPQTGPQTVLSKFM